MWDNPHLGANGKKLVGRSLLEVVGINVGNIWPCYRQCRHSLVPCIKISFVGQAHGDLDTLWLVTTPRRGCFGLKDPPDQASSWVRHTIHKALNRQGKPINWDWGSKELNRALEVWAFFGSGECDCHAHLGIVSGTCSESGHRTIVGTFDDGLALFSLIPESPAEPSAQGPNHQRPLIQSETHAVHNRSSGLGSPLLSHFDQPTARSLPFPSTLALCREAACSNSW